MSFFVVLVELGSRTVLRIVMRFYQTGYGMGTDGLTMVNFDLGG
jgi:hypothetical protein